MDTLRLLIQEKLMDGRLPIEAMPRVWGGPGNGETCDACDGKAEKSDLVIEGRTERGQVVFFHPKCFYVWQKEQEYAVAACTSASWVDAPGVTTRVNLASPPLRQYPRGDHGPRDDPHHHPS